MASRRRGSLRPASRCPSRFWSSPPCDDPPISFFKVARHSLLVSGFGWREAVLALLILAPLACLFLFVGPIPQDQSFHALADRRTFLGVPNFADVASNLPFLLVGAAGMLWCFGNAGAGARSSWMVLFLGVALVFFGSGYYHLAPHDDSLVW